MEYALMLSVLIIHKAHFKVAMLLIVPTYRESHDINGSVQTLQINNINSILLM